MTHRCSFLVLSLLAGVAPLAAQAADADIAPPPLPAVHGCVPCQSGLREGIDAPVLAVPADTGERPHAIEYSDAYGVRLTIHRYASYVEIPLFITEYIVGEKVLRDRRNGVVNGRGQFSSVRGLHTGVSLALGGLFAVNTVTGAWNLWDSRKDPAGRTRRWLHAVTMLAADAGFLWTAAAIRDARRSDAGAVVHRRRAVISMSLATASTIMMWLWKD